jgi:hypothetical protein
LSHHCLLEREHANGNKPEQQWWLWAHLPHSKELEPSLLAWEGTRRWECDLSSLWASRTRFKNKDESEFDCKIISFRSTWNKVEMATNVVANIPCTLMGLIGRRMNPSTDKKFQLGAVFGHGN